jgi:hypothetical protein
MKRLALALAFVTFSAAAEDPPYQYTAENKKIRFTLFAHTVKPLPKSEGMFGLVQMISLTNEHAPERAAVVVFGCKVGYGRTVMVELPSGKETTIQWVLGGAAISDMIARDVCLLAQEQGAKL